jgi:hypothetical protein
MSEPKYSNGQKVKIIRAKDEQNNIKYPTLDDHVGKEGIIIDYADLGIKLLPNKDSGLNEHVYVYFINIGGIDVIGVFEEMIQVISG